MEGWGVGGDTQKHNHPSKTSVNNNTPPTRRPRTTPKFNETATPSRCRTMSLGSGNSQALGQHAPRQVPAAYLGQDQPPLPPTHTR
ncbi:hypothetical protein E2C01_095479 [Portunus trituberculatus]|uniref:Uncharacterized protein n=1 Tax=Portunus trituberculatus TaxID=210409 RepID=A0A5B7JT47_PORTR|nr:hypothetical protein [Portunus trituberculatus]